MEQVVANAIAQYRAAQQANEAAIAAVNPAAYVMMWNGAVLKTDGKQVAMLGTSIYSSKGRYFMQREADKFSAVVQAKLSADMMMDAKVTVHTAAEALAIVKAENADMLAKIEAANA